MKAFLILEDGNVFTGTAIGAEKEVISEIVFNTSMTGYLEILTDPTYAGQAVVMTYPLSGNYGVCYADMQSGKAWPNGYIVREMARLPQNFRSENTLEAFLREKDIAGIAGIDTRALTKILREKGTMNGMITTKEDYNKEEVLAKLAAYRITGKVEEVTCSEKKTLTPADAQEFDTKFAPQYLIKQAPVTETLYHVAVLDLGVKVSILDSLVRRGCEVTVYPANTPAEEILAEKPDGIVLSNGPGDPAECTEIIAEVKKLSESGVPVFGIGLGHQLLALAHGAKTEKMNHGHRGANQPVKNVQTGRVMISTQHHGYTVVDGSLSPEVGTVSYINVNDGTVEGISYKDKKVCSVQFHPDSCEGTQSTCYLYDEFIDMMK